MAFAQTSPPPAPTAPSATNGPAKLGETRTDKSGVNESLATCLAMWDRATHMSQQEWTRACRRVDQRLRSITVK